MNAAMEAAPGLIDLGPIDAIPIRGSRVVEIARRRIALFRTADDRVFALEDRCPHKGGPLSQGLVHGEQVTCPLHGWTVSLDTGEAVAPDRGCARRIPASVVDGHILLDAMAARA